MSTALSSAFLTKKAQAYSDRFWDLHFQGVSQEAIWETLKAEGCPTPAEIEAAFIAENGYGFEAAGEIQQAKADAIAEARYDERYCF